MIQDLNFSLNSFLNNLAVTKNDFTGNGCMYDFGAVYTIPIGWESGKILMY